MSALTDRIGAEHYFQWPCRNTSPTTTYRAFCACGTEVDGFIGHTVHVADVTEAAVREQVARDLEDRRRGAGLFYGDFRAGWLHGMDAAVETVRGGVA